MEVSATVDGFLQPSKPHLHVLLLPPTSCHPVFLLIIVAAHTSLIKTSYKSYGHLVILVIGRGNIETGRRKSAYYTRDRVGSPNSHPSLALGLAVK